MKKTYFKYIAALLLFGSNGIVASYISLSSYEIVLLRALIGGLLLIAVYVLSNGKMRFLQNRRQFFFLAASGAAMGASWMLLYEAYRHMGVGIASLAYYCGPVIVMALSPLLFREKLTLAKAGGFLAVLCGMLLINLKALEQGKTGWGLFCGGMSAVMYAVMVMLNKKAEGVGGLENSMLQLIFGFLTAAVFVGAKQGLFFPMERGDWPPVLILGLLNTGIGCYLYFSAIGRLPVQSVAICGYLEPLSAVLFSVLLLHETMAPVQILGAVLILGGAAFAESISAYLDKQKPRTRGDRDMNHNNQGKGG